MCMYIYILLDMYIYILLEIYIIRYIYIYILLCIYIVKIIYIYIYIYVRIYYIQCYIHTLVCIYCNRCRPTSLIRAMGHVWTAGTTQTLDAVIRAVGGPGEEINGKTIGNLGKP